MSLKMKTNKSVSKRFRVTAHGKLKYKKQGLRHILTKKSSKRKRKLGKAATLSNVETKKLLRVLPYGN